MTALATDREPALLSALGPAAQLALLARALHRAGYDDHTAGHITYAVGDGTLLVNPFELYWEELTASDIVHIDAVGRKLAGRHTVTPAIELHLAIHRLREDVRIAVHNHPEYATVWAALHEIPPIYDQVAATIPDSSITVYNEYEGVVSSAAIAARNIESMDTDKTAAFLANHGVLVFAKNFAHAYLSCSALERRSKLAWQVHALGQGLGRPMDPVVARQYGERMAAREDPWPHLWAAVMRREVRLDPSVLD
jgi:L-fuculose-phosphate aldolase